VRLWPFPLRASPERPRVFGAVTPRTQPQPTTAEAAAAAAAAAAGYGFHDAAGCVFFLAPPAPPAGSADLAGGARRVVPSCSDGQLPPVSSLAGHRGGPILSLAFARDPLACSLSGLNCASAPPASSDGATIIEGGDGGGGGGGGGRVGGWDWRWLLASAGRDSCIRIWRVPPPPAAAAAAFAVAGALSVVTTVAASAAPSPALLVPLRVLPLAAGCDVLSLRLWTPAPAPGAGGASAALFAFAGASNGDLSFWSVLESVPASADGCASGGGGKLRTLSSHARVRV
jgi:hypothetical protein